MNTMTDEFVRIWKEAAVAYFKVLSQYSHRETQKTSFTIGCNPVEIRTEDLPITSLELCRHTIVRGAEGNPNKVSAT